MSRLPGPGSGPSTRRRFLRMTAGFIAGWAALLRHVTMGRAAVRRRRALGAATVEIMCPEGWLSTDFTGTSTLTTTESRARGPSEEPITIGVDFNAARDQICISKFSPIVSDRATVTYAGGPLGTFDPATGALAITLNLRFDVRRDVILFEEDSTLTISLFTTGDSRAAPLDPTTGAATLVGTGDFHGGDLFSGDEGTLVLEGRFSPIPLLENQGVEELTAPLGGVEGADPARPLGGALEAILHLMMQ